MTQAYYYTASNSLNMFIQTVSELSEGLVMYICKVGKMLLVLEI